MSPIWPLSSPVNTVMSLDFSDSQSSLQDKDGKACHATRGVQRSRHSAEHTAGSEHVLEREDAAAGDDVLTGVHPYGSPALFPCNACARMFRALLRCDSHAVGLAL